jgi:hypothetical protein
MLALLLAATLSMPTPDLTCRVRDKHGHLVRSMSRRAMFLRMSGHPDGKVPKGYAVDHVIPLACGGCDLPSTMQLLTVAEWKAKTPWERRPCSAWWDGTNSRLLQKAVDASKVVK